MANKFGLNQSVVALASTGKLEGLGGTIVGLPSDGDPTYLVRFDGIGETFVEEFDIELATDLLSALDDDFFADPPTNEERLKQVGAPAWTWIGPAPCCSDGLCKECESVI